ncbi:progranulin-like [Ornithodoros turicata]|uniref:progranulin-like n=1 Tax=Ornithodoros turicata TaxID=34597 RepID=UPI00313969BD
MAAGPHVLVLLILSITATQGEYIECPDRSYCPAKTTCCLLTTGQYGCCHIEHAVCCTGHDACCPEGYRCQVSTHSCTKGSTSIAMSEKSPSLSLDVVLAIQREYIECPDRSYCPAKTTCCLLTTGQYGCCHIEHAVCCTGQDACCPEGYRCQVSTHSCTKGSTSIAMSEKRPSLSLDVVLAIQREYIECPDRSYCPAKTTCCLLTTGQYGCCHIEHAVCCTGHDACCPEGYRCQVSTHSCTKGSTSIAMSEKRPSLSLDMVLSLQSSEVTCPDQTRCPGGRTCCKTEDGKYSCCPFSEAVCCDDGVHCCPTGHQCNPEEGSCESNEKNEIVSMLKKFPSTPAP